MRTVKKIKQLVKLKKVAVKMVAIRIKFRKTYLVAIEQIQEREIQKRRGKIMNGNGFR